jgi:hypothetical protein
MNIANEDLMMETFDRWADRERRERFLRRMAHKLRAKELRNTRHG